MNDEIMTAKEAAAFLKVCRQSLPKMPVPSHPLPGMRNRRRYLKSELLAWVAKSKEQATGLVVRLH
jgi:hypothetical protein